MQPQNAYAYEYTAKNETRQRPHLPSGKRIRTKSFRHRARESAEMAIAAETAEHRGHRTNLSPQSFGQDRRHGHSLLATDEEAGSMMPGSVHPEKAERHIRFFLSTSLQALRRQSSPAVFIQPHAVPPEKEQKKLRQKKIYSPTQPLSMLTRIISPHMPQARERLIV